ncbi:MAG: GDP-mannose 4,6-dehydratase [Kiritimatiellae bacterium]|nr:GDP-mannose 4,6-dehydratase [Kiritimatiellia bacterium]
MHAALEFMRRGWSVTGIDNFCDYYSPELKRSRMRNLIDAPGNFTMKEIDICDLRNLKNVFHEVKPDVVLNLAAQPGVRYSITHPFVYQKTNIEGFLNILECCRNSSPKPKLVYASSSSVYGGNKKMPFEESDSVDSPVSLYAATKKANELMAHTYSHLYDMQTIGLRFFTVYGSWYRPDMALTLFADAMTHGYKVKAFNNGDMLRDFTYVDDIVAGIVRVVESKTLPKYDIYNIGNHRCEKLLDVINILADSLGVKPDIEYLPMQSGDVYATYASIDKLRNAVGYEPKTTIKEGIPVFAKWYKEYHGL